MSRIAHRRRQLRIESLESRRVLTATTLVSTPDYTLKLDDSDSFVIMEVPSDGYTEWDNGTSSRSLATQRIYDLFTDDFDFIMFVNNASTHSASYSGQYSSVQNEITGTGDSIFDLTSNYGSAGALQGVIHLTRGSGIRGGPSLHEIMHRWANDVTLLGGDTSGHWGYTNVGGQLGGWQSGTLVDNGNGTFNADGPTGSDWFGTFANGGNGLPYSQFELYLMGLIDANEVTQDIIVANDPVWTNSGIGEFSASSLTTYSIGDIVADEGPREPNVANSQKDFRAMVVVVSAGPMSEGEQTAFTTDIANFSANGSDGINGIYNFWEATGGRANIQMDDLAATLADSGSVSGTIWEDVNENLVQDAGEVGIPNRQVYLDGNGNGVRDEQRDTFYASDVTQDIADQATTNSVLHLNGYAGSITDLNVNLFIEHTSDQQLEVTLMSPTGTTATLFNSVGDGGQDFLDTTLDDEAATPIGSGAAPFTGSFRPTESLSAFDNEDPNGNWTLSITDSAAGGGGRLVAWSIDLGTGQQEPAASTTANGDYQIDNVASGEYEVRQVPFAGSTQTFPSATARLVVTEISLNTPDWLEIQNVSTAAIDTTGWSVALAENPAGGINNISSVVWDLPDSVNAGEVLYRTDTNDNYWGTNINWSEFNGATGWVMIIDDTGNMVDWVGWGWAESALSQLDVTVNGHVIQGVGSHWSGTSPSGDDPTADQTGTLRRIGAADTNSGADWEWNAPGSLGMENPDLTTPLSASDFHTISVRAGEVTDNVDFGNLTADAPPQVTSVELNATQIDPPDLAKGPQPTKWQVQRSDIRSIEVAFSTTMSNLTPADLRLTNLGIDAPNEADAVVPLTAGQLATNGNTLTISFSEDQLSEGVYSLEILPTATDQMGAALDGDSDGESGGTFGFEGNDVNKFYKLRAEWSGDNGVSVFDFSTFSYWFGAPVGTAAGFAPAYVNLNGDDGVSVFDFGGFSANFGMGVEFNTALLARGVPISATDSRAKQTGRDSEIVVRRRIENLPDRWQHNQRPIRDELEFQLPPDAVDSVLTDSSFFQSSIDTTYLLLSHSF